MLRYSTVAVAQRAPRYRKWLWTGAGVAATVGVASLTFNTPVLQHEQVDQQKPATALSYLRQQLSKAAATIWPASTWSKPSLTETALNRIRATSARWLAQWAEDPEAREALLAFGSNTLLDFLINTATDDPSPEQAHAEQALSNFLQGYHTSTRLLARPGAISRLLEHIASGKASERLVEGLTAVLANRGADLSQGLSREDGRELIGMLKGGHGHQVQSLALKFLTAWAKAGGHEQCKQLVDAGLATAVAQLAMEAVGQGEQGRQLQKAVCRCQRALLTEPSAVSDEQLATWMQPLLYMAADAAAAAAAAAAATGGKSPYAGLGSSSSSSSGGMLGLPAGAADLAVADVAMTTLGAAVAAGGPQVKAALSDLHVIPTLDCLALSQDPSIRARAAAALATVVTAGHLEAAASSARWTDMLLTWLTNSTNNMLKKPNNSVASAASNQSGGWLLGSLFGSSGSSSSSSSEGDQGCSSAVNPADEALARSCVTALRALSQQPGPVGLSVAQQWLAKLLQQLSGRVAAYTSITTLVSASSSSNGSSRSRKAAAALKAAGAVALADSSTASIADLPTSKMIRDAAAAIRQSGSSSGDQADLEPDSLAVPDSAAAAAAADGETAATDSSSSTWWWLGSRWWSGSSTDKSNNIQTAESNASAADDLWAQLEAAKEAAWRDAAPVTAASAKAAADDLKAASNAMLAGWNAAALALPSDLVPGMLVPAVEEAYPAAARVVDYAVAQQRTVQVMEILASVVAEDPVKQSWLLAAGILPLMERLVLHEDAGLDPEGFVNRYSSSSTGSSEEASSSSSSSASSDKASSPSSSSSSTGRSWWSWWGSSSSSSSSSAPLGVEPAAAATSATPEAPAAAAAAADPSAAAAAASISVVQQQVSNATVVQQQGLALAQQAAAVQQVAANATLQHQQQQQQRQRGALPGNGAANAQAAVSNGTANNVSTDWHDHVQHNNFDNDTGNNDNINTCKGIDQSLLGSSSSSGSKVAAATVAGKPVVKDTRIASRDQRWKNALNVECAFGHDLDFHDAVESDVAQDTAAAAAAAGALGQRLAEGLISKFTAAAWSSSSSNKDVDRTDVAAVAAAESDDAVADADQGNGSSSSSSNSSSGVSPNISMKQASTAGSAATRDQTASTAAAAAAKPQAQRHPPSTALMEFAQGTASWDVTNDPVYSQNPDPKTQNPSSKQTLDTATALTAAAEEGSTWFDGEGLGFLCLQRQVARVLGMLALQPAAAWGLAESAVGSDSGAVGVLEGLGLALGFTSSAELDGGSKTPTQEGVVFSNPADLLNPSKRHGLRSAAKPRSSSSSNNGSDQWLPWLLAAAASDDCLLSSYATVALLHLESAVAHQLHQQQQQQHSSQPGGSSSSSAVSRWKQRLAQELQAAEEDITALIEELWPFGFAASGSSSSNGDQGLGDRAWRPPIYYPDGIHILNPSSDHHWGLLQPPRATLLESLGAAAANAAATAAAAAASDLAQSEIEGLAVPPVVDSTAAAADVAAVAAAAAARAASALGADVSQLSQLQQDSSSSSTAGSGDTGSSSSSKDLGFLQPAIVWFAQKLVKLAALKEEQIQEQQQHQQRGAHGGSGNGDAAAPLSTYAAVQALLGGSSSSTLSGSSDSAAQDSSANASLQQQQQQQRVTPAPQPPDFDIIFIHGIRGGPFVTWRRGGLYKRGSSSSSSSAADGTTKPGSSSKGGIPLTPSASMAAHRNHMTQGDCWPAAWLANDLPGARILSVEYKAPVTGWEGESLSLPDSGRLLLEKLVAAGVGQRPVVFVAHSMGGLVVKEMLSQSLEEPPTSKKGRLASATKAIAFYSTPHFGSSMAALGWKLRHLPGASPAPSIHHLSPGPHLAALNARLALLHDTGRVQVLSFTEGLATSLAGLGFLPKIVIVPYESAYPGFGQVHVLADKDHIDVCKPERRDAPAYAKLLEFIRASVVEVVDNNGGVQAVITEDVERCSVDSEDVAMAQSA